MHFILPHLKCNPNLGITRIWDCKSLFGNSENCASGIYENLQNQHILFSYTNTVEKRIEKLIYRIKTKNILQVKLNSQLLLSIDIDLTKAERDHLQ